MHEGILPLSSGWMIPLPSVSPSLYGVNDDKNALRKIAPYQQLNRTRVMTAFSG
jgi:hypothetical protein